MFSYVDSTFSTWATNHTSICACIHLIIHYAHRYQSMQDNQSNSSCFIRANVWKYEYSWLLTDASCAMVAYLLNAFSALVENPFHMCIKQKTKQYMGHELKCQSSKDEHNTIFYVVSSFMYTDAKAPQLSQCICRTNNNNDVSNVSFRRKDVFLSTISKTPVTLTICSVYICMHVLKHWKRERERAIFRCKSYMTH